VNIVDVIRDQIPGPAISQLSQLIGKSESTTGSAVAATVPSLLAAFSKMASTESGMQMFEPALEKFNPQVLRERPETLADKGTDMAESLLGPAGISPIVDSLTRSFGIGSFGAKKLVGFLTPVVLGGVVRQFSGRTVSPEALTSLFSQQKRNIAHAVPPGFAGAESPLHAGVDRMKDTVRAIASTGRSRSRWLLPAALGLAVVALVLLVSRPRPSSRPERTDEDVAARLGNELNAAVDSVTGTLNGITDERTAEAALPKLAEARSKVDEIRATASVLPQESRTKLDQRAQSRLAALREQSTRVESIPGAGEKVQPVLDDLITRLSTPVGGAPADGQHEVR
jgi:hypothetical protein